MTIRRFLQFSALSLVAALWVVFAGLGRAGAADPPPDFVDLPVADEIYAPVQLAMAPDGRLVVLTDSGRAHIIVDDQLLATPFFDLRSAVDDVADRGLFSLAFDNDFAVNGYVYIVYTHDTNGVDDGIGRNRVSRLTVTGNTAGNEVVLFEDFPDADVSLHYGGAVEMGPDGKLYVTVGDYLLGVNGQDRTNIKGTVLRLNTDGSIPTDNPFYDELSGVSRAIYAYGLRNPWQTAKHPITGEILISDVGSDEWEELNSLQAGANYGWFIAEGPSDPGDPAQADFTDPIWAFPHFGVVPGADIEGCAIIGGAFYETPGASFPTAYRGSYFSGDYCTGAIYAVDTATGQAEFFMDGFFELVDMAVSPVNGDLYYIDRRFNGDGVFPRGGVGKISYSGELDEITITSEPSDVSIAAGGTASFFVGVAAPGNVTYEWLRNDVPIAGETGPQLVIENVGPDDDGDFFTARISNGVETVFSRDALLTITDNTAPVPVISIGDVGAGYVAGEPITYSGSATDAEDGTLPDTSLQWEIRLNHDAHDHELVGGLTGAGGTFSVPPAIETSTNVWITVYLTATDSDGTSSTVSRRIDPLITTVTLETDPAGLNVEFEGDTVATPYSFDSVAGVLREISAPATQVAAGTTYSFTGWSDGFGRDEPRPTATTDATITASYEPVPVGDICVATALAGGGVRIDWQDKPGTEVVRNAGGWVATPPAGVLTYTDPDGSVDDGWLIRRTRGGGDEICDTVGDPDPPDPPDPPVDPTCVVTAAAGGGVLIDWDPVAGENRYNVRFAAGTWIATVLDATDYVYAAGSLDQSFVVRYNLGAGNVDIACVSEGDPDPPDPPDPPVDPTCVVTAAAGGGVLIDWDPVAGENRYNVRFAAGTWIATVLDATDYVYAAGSLDQSFVVRYNLGAGNVDIACVSEGDPDPPDPPDPPTGCTVTAIAGGVRVDWTDQPGTEIVRNDAGWVATPPEGTVSHTEPGGTVDDGWFIRRRSPTSVDEICTIV